MQFLYIVKKITLEIVCPKMLGINPLYKPLIPSDRYI